MIELLVVIAIVGVLSGIVFQSLQSARFKAQNATRLSDIDQIDKAVQLYLTRTGASLPTSPTGWECIGTSGTCLDCGTSYSTAANLNAALNGNISKIPKDPVIATTADGGYYVYAKVASSIYAYNGSGSYLRWHANNLGSNPCGRGNWVYASQTYGGFLMCALFIGKN